MNCEFCHDEMESNEALNCQKCHATLCNTCADEEGRCPACSDHLDEYMGEDQNVRGQVRSKKTYREYHHDIERPKIRLSDYRRRDGVTVRRAVR
ncbi:MAG: hypothetical protein WC525_07560 [Candidatus Thermoplasmatota archaeon]